MAKAIATLRVLLLVALTLALPHGNMTAEISGSGHRGHSQQLLAVSDCIDVACEQPAIGATDCALALCLSCCPLPGQGAPGTFGYGALNSYGLAAATAIHGTRAPPLHRPPIETSTAA